LNFSSPDYRQIIDTYTSTPSASSKTIPTWVQHNSIKKRSIADSIEKFLQLAVSGALPINFNANLGKKNENKILMYNLENDNYF
jgi:hypothetical protein